jgi:aromatic-L-amino-acid decarboxylase
VSDVPFRDAGHAAIDWIAGYLDGIERYPVLSPVKPGEIVAALPASPPEMGESMDAILRDFESTIVPGITHWNHPAFFGYFATTASTPGIVAESLIAALDVKAMLWKTSPAATELEMVTVGWLRQMLGLDDGWFGLTTDTASMSSMLALAAAREAREGLSIRERGMSGRDDLPRLRVYASAEAHSSIDKGMIALGLGLENLVRVPTDDRFRMRGDRLDAMIADDRARGYLPIACCT